MMEAPIVTLVRFWENHHLLDLVQRPVWRVVKDRSRSYVSVICAGKEHTCMMLTRDCVWHVSHPLIWQDFESNSRIKS
jgi:predicted NAD/FAD-binding protein